MTQLKALPLKRESLDSDITAFLTEHSLQLRSNNISDRNVKRVVIGKVGINDAMIDLHLNGDGTTTINPKVGKNQELGQELVKHLLSTIEPDEFKSVNFVLKGITSEDIEPIFESVQEAKDDQDVNEFDLEVPTDDKVKKLVKITSVKHQDSITITHFKTTNKLMIQGKPLFGYRNFIYLMSHLLDLAGLELVLSKTDEDKASIVRKEVAEDYLRIQLPDSYEKLPQITQSFLLSGCCVKLASPKLPEYSMLLFPDLRSLEGVLKEFLSEYDMHPSEEVRGFGTFLYVENDSGVLRRDFRSRVDCGNMVKALENAYAFFSKNRNSMFHMEEFAEASRKVDTLDKALGISKDCYQLINELYKVKVD